MSDLFTQYLLSRSSTPIVKLAAPGPNADQIKTMIEIAARVPDHGQLAPWRFIVYSGDNRIGVGKLLADYLELRDGALSAGARAKEEERFSRAPLVIGVIFCPREHIKIPQWEMFLSAGAAAMNLVHGAHSLGFGCNWITNWYSDDEGARSLLGVMPDERVVGFIHIGTKLGEGPMRERPDVDALISEYNGPVT